MNQTKSFGGEDEEGRKCPPQITYIDILYFCYNNLCTHDCYSYKYLRY